MLAALRLSGAAAGVHEKQRRFGIHRNRRHDCSRVFGKNLVYPDIAVLHKRSSGSILALVPPPDEDLVHHMAFLLGSFQRDICARFVVQHFTVAIVAIHGDQDVALRIGGAHAARLAAKTAKDHRVDHAQAGASQHGDGQLGDHRHVNGDAISGLETAVISQQGREFIDSHIEFAVGDGYSGFRLRFRNKDQGRFVLVLVEMPIHAVVGGVDLAAHEPLPERRIAGVEGFVPVLVPSQQVGVFAEAFRVILFAKAFDDAGIGQIRLADKLRVRIVILFLAPVNCNLSFGGFAHRLWFRTYFRHIDYPLYC